MLPVAPGQQFICTAVSLAQKLLQYLLSCFKRGGQGARHVANNSACGDALCSCDGHRNRSSLAGLDRGRTRMPMPTCSVNCKPTSIISFNTHHRLHRPKLRRSSCINATVPSIHPAAYPTTLLLFVCLLMCMVVMVCPGTTTLLWFGMGMNIFFGNVIAITQQALWGRALDHAVW